ncbi:MAG: hypothetical protein OXI77_08455 [Chloroflexota bacterium]|nr:hypothetical protein [Chloroflexota bacterium]MDE2910709.1 hypothetical protein [Chloroflexota bacterium]
MNTLSTSARSHLPFLIIMPLLIIAMTWPTLALVVDANTIAFPTRSADVFQKLWDVWHGRQFLAGHTGFYHSDALFYPGGLSLAFENFSLPHMLSVLLLGAALPAANAYNLTYLLIVLAVALSGYFYLNYLFGDPWLAAVGATVFGFSQHIIAHAAHPDVNLIVSLPLTAYCFQRGIREWRIKYLVCCGLIAGLTAFFSLYIFVCLLITLALFILRYAVSRWADPRFWRWVLLLCLVIALASAGRILPLLADAEELAAALDKNTAYETGTDLLSYFVNYRHPLTTPLLKSVFGPGSPFYQPHTSYLGYLPLALIIIGFVKPAGRRAMRTWLALALPFLILRLGSVLQIGGQQFSHIVLPKALLNEVAPALFSPFHATDHFQMGILLPWAVMTCYGLKTIIAARPAKQRALIALALIAGIAFEYYESTAVRKIPAEQLAFIEGLRADGADQEPRLINLPMGRQPSKLYGFYQTLTGFPQVEGLSGRTPPSAYAYIDGNFLLEAWRRGAGVHCAPPHQSIFIAALDQLANDGFTHIVWHHWRGEDAAIASSFVDAPAAYGDDYVSVYRLEDLRRSCDLSNSLSPSLLEPLRRLATAAAVVPQQGSAILSILPEGKLDLAAGQTGAAALFGLRSYTSLALVDGQVAALPSPVDTTRAAADLLARNRIILLAFNPQTTTADLIDSYRAWLDPRFKSCRRLTDKPAAILEYFLDAAFPCELAVTARPLQVDYANGIQLGNLLVEFIDGFVDINLLWTRLPEDAHAFSIQFIDADGARAGGADFVIGLEPLARHRIDTASLPAGEYRLNLILYDYATGRSVSGVETESGSSFERALDIGRFTLSDTEKTVDD